MTNITFSNYKSVVYHGARIVYDSNVGTIQANSSWNGGYMVNGLSILHVLENFNNIKLIDSRVA